MTTPPNPLPGPAPTVRDELFGPRRRAVTLGIVLLISLVAFEQMGVGTAMPAVVADLGTLADYAWPFVAFIAPTVVGTVLGGRWSDARGPRLVLLLAPAVFGLGLLVAGTVAAALGVAALSWAGQHPTVLGALLAVAALVVLVPALRRLVPTGTVRARRGIAAVVAGRGLIAGAYFTVTAFLPLMLTATHGWSLSAAGLPLIVGSLGWSGAAAWQGRRPDLPRPRLLRVGMLLIAAGTAGLLVVAPAWGVAWAALPLWLVAGVGMGLGFSSLSALLLVVLALTGAAIAPRTAPHPACDR
ncbi:hypothetical protein LWC33_20725 [Pseudonocardia sp. RS11V-5]|uniref:hypothetical protein n=1 Tax=Pseudonocardia terrae TaxID=2905831 RepID=UPI001E2BC76B|nr:hypothetical protein [Pseudonocardia terrae]MCE3553869.1 hypothetical protein [Pseudonocardia terrae]